MMSSADRSADATGDFQPLLIPTHDVNDLRRVIPVYERILLAQLDAILARSRRDAGGFVDTKLDIITGRELSRIVGSHDIFGPDTVYAWIQGRAMEALAGHAVWIRNAARLPPDRREACLADIRAVVERVTHAMESVRMKNGGVLFFWFDRDGQSFLLDPDGQKRLWTPEPGRSNMSDLFYAKGLMAAAHLLERPDWTREARIVFSKIIRDIRAGRFYSDQQQLDPKNRVGEVPNRMSHGPRMIAIGAFALFASLAGDPEYITGGMEFIAHILDRHANVSGQFPNLREYDFVEFLDGQGRPYLDNGHVVSDTGHAAEFVGLSLKFLDIIENSPCLTPDQRAFIETCRAVLPPLLIRNVQSGFNRAVGGICKTYSLNRRAPLNDDMPWWNLPETMRASLFACRAARDSLQKKQCLDIFRLCSNAFLANYVNPRVHLMAYQTLDKNGRPVPVVPATPDADPGYHTGLSVIDALNILSALHP